ncbi:E3 ubiquitin-protein ligase Mdm2-like isoform X1 [Aphis craccivora]|uniref:E3 ubiquitin-protein ligase Mdm2-like isoform X1 n=1 Tax=Aphis craccivora TaxID=307492 RepID=A0A6G0YKH5_APHCR|nr:E3 ubiquitin-protein ligase Mdm2-like isoform X1 [Aphis craccivora]
MADHSHHQTSNLKRLHVEDINGPVLGVGELGDRPGHQYIMAAFRVQILISKFSDLLYQNTSMIKQHILLRPFYIFIVYKSQTTFFKSKISLKSTIVWLVVEYLSKYEALESISIMSNITCMLLADALKFDDDGWKLGGLALRKQITLLIISQIHNFYVYKNLNNEEFDVTWGGKKSRYLYTYKLLSPLPQTSTSESETDSVGSTQTKSTGKAGVKNEYLHKFEI